MKKIRGRTCHLALLALLAIQGSALEANVRAAEKSIRINLGTLAPRGSVYHQSLQAMAEAWRQAPEGGVRLVIYPDGTQGGEADMVRLMRVGSLQAGLLTTVGLSSVEPTVSGMQSAPLMFHDFKEFDFVSEKLRPSLEKRIADKGFVVLFWVDAGWIRYFSKEPVLTPADLRRMKIFSWAGYPEQVSIMRKAGFSPVPLETSDILPGLQTGLINTVALPPIFALATQVDVRAPNMLNLNWAPLVGACVVKKDVWEKIAPPTREALLASATRTGNEIRANSRKESSEAVVAMQKRGLKVHDISPESTDEWRKEAAKSYPDVRGTLIPAEVFDDVQRFLQEYRGAAAGK
jgi:TRAP-type transport system periplasmic protein